MSALAPAFLRVAAVVLVACSLAGCARAPRPGAGSPATASTPMPDAQGFNVQPLGIPAGKTAGEGLRERLDRGENLQFLVTGPPGSVLQPGTARATFGPDPMPTELFLLEPSQALFFVIVTEPEARLSGKLRLEAPLLDEQAALRATFDVPPGPLAPPPPRTGPSVVARDADGAPLAGVRVFGQTRRDMLGQTGEDGAVVLDAPERYTPSHHWASLRGFWSVPFHPLQTQEVTMHEAPEFLFGATGVEVASGVDDARHAGSSVVATVRDEATGAPVPGALVGVQRTYWVRAGKDGKARVVVPEGADVIELQALAPGRPIRAVFLEPGARSAEILLPAGAP